MLSKLLGKKLDHPMAEMKSAQALLDELPKSDALKSLMELTDWMESVAGNDEFKLDHQFAVICLLDETAYGYARKLSAEYFSSHAQARFQEHRLWLVLGGWYLHSYRAYLRVFNRYYEAEKNSALIRANLPLLAARTVRAMMASLKYACVHYGPIDDAIWLLLCQVYRHAEHEHYLNTPVNLYPALPRSSSVQLEVARLLAWYGCGVHSLSPLAMHLTDRLITHHLACIEIAPQPNAGTVFSWDLNTPRMPHRFNVDATLHSYLRYVNISGLSARLEALLPVLRKHIVPEELVLGGEYDAGLVLETASYLLNYLTVVPQRRTVRHTIQLTTKVVSEPLSHRTDAESGGDFAASAIRLWQIENISTSGFYTMLPQHGQDGFYIGHVLAVQPGELTHWGLAVVRRLMRDEANNLHVGVELLSPRIETVQLHRSDARAGDAQIGLWLHPRNDVPNEGYIAVLVGSYVPNHSLETELNGKQYLLIPHRLLHKNIECDLVEFRLVEHEAGDD